MFDTAKSGQNSSSVWQKPKCFCSVCNTMAAAWALSLSTDDDLAPYLLVLVLVGIRQTSVRNIMLMEGGAALWREFRKPFLKPYRGQIFAWFCWYSRIPLSCAPLTRENQLVALAPWTPNFSDATLATAPHDWPGNPHVLKWANFSTRVFIAGDMTTLWSQSLHRNTQYPPAEPRRAT